MIRTVTSLREGMTPAQRAMDVVHSIDPGFVHHRMIETILSPRGMALVDRAIADLPELPVWQRKVRIDHILTRAMLAYCLANEVPTLRSLLASGEGTIFCSTEQIEGKEEVYDAERVRARIVLEGEWDKEVFLDYSTRHIASDTLRYLLSEDGHALSIIATVQSVDAQTAVFQPCIIGAPWLDRPEAAPDFAIEWYGEEFYEHFVEDFDEFSRVAQVPEPPDSEPMRKVSEAAFKRCLATLLGDTSPVDWGGEQSDFFAAHLHLQGKRVTGAFLLKGPSHFAPMGLNHLGKNNDQIYRLAQEPADVLFVQHCHDILPQVRATLRAFAVQPSHPRRYCLIDGRDSLRLLLAYGLYEQAVAGG